MASDITRMAWWPDSKVMAWEVPPAKSCNVLENPAIDIPVKYTGGVPLEELTIEQYDQLDAEGRAAVKAAVLGAVDVAIELNYMLFQRYDQDCGPGGNIPANMLVNAIIHVTHQKMVKPCPKEHGPDWYANKQARCSWDPWLLLVKRNYDFIVEESVRMCREKHNAFTNVRFAPSLCHGAWLYHYAETHDREIWNTYFDISQPLYQARKARGDNAQPAFTVRYIPVNKDNY